MIIGFSDRRREKLFAGRAEDTGIFSFSIRNTHRVTPDGSVRFFSQAGFEPVKTIPVNSAEAFFTLIAAGVGVGLLSPLHLGSQCEGVAPRRLTDPVMHFPLSLIWDTRRASPLVDDFLDVVKQVLPKLNGTLKPNNQERPVAAMNGVRAHS